MDLNRFKYFFKLLGISYCSILVIRILETILIYFKFGNQSSLFTSEFIGFFCDIIYLNITSLILLPIFYFSQSKHHKREYSGLLILLIFVLFLHFLIIQYFLYQQELLDFFLFKYSFREIFYTVKTSDTNYSVILIQTAILSIIIFLVIYYYHTIFRKFNQKLFIYSIAFSIPIFIFLLTSLNSNLNKYSINKSLYFYYNSISSIFRENDDQNDYSADDAIEFQKLFKKDYLNTEYPLIHRIDTTDYLSQHCEKFDIKPNIVILIVEGLNDDFIHSYKGVDIMPFLNQLKSKSLYWSKCFSLGERSYAVVPALLGSLPYGKTGFTLLERYPKHHTLISILHSNNYYTSFFYGQGSWFHQKDAFFRFNNIDLIFDNAKFSDKYKKIIVGEDNFFWGYNDKDLFNQSFEIIDTLPFSPKLNIYFTGSTHSPFAISDDIIYEQKLIQLINNCNQQDKDFYLAYKKYFKSILFADDALKEFFNNYKKRADFGNTIFVITGDHPITEIPIKNSIKRYHVPLMIYGEKIHKPEEFKHIVSHLDFYETILAFLKSNKIRIPGISCALGNNLFTKNNINQRYLSFMNGNRDIIDIYHENYFLSKDQLYQVDSCLNIKSIENEPIKKELERNLFIFKKTSLHTSIQDKIIDKNNYYEGLDVKELFSYNNISLKTINHEYFDLIPEIVINNCNMYLDIDFKYSDVSPETMIVYQLCNEKDSIFHWESLELKTGSGLYMMHKKISKNLNFISKVKFKSFIWNRNKSSFNLKDLKISLHNDK